MADAQGSPTDGEIDQLDAVAPGEWTDDQWRIFCRLVEKGREKIGRNAARVLCEQVYCISVETYTKNRLRLQRRQTRTVQKVQFLLQEKTNETPPDPQSYFDRAMEKYAQGIQCRGDVYRPLMKTWIEERLHRTFSDFPEAVRGLALTYLPQAVHYARICADKHQLPLETMLLLMINATVERVIFFVPSTLTNLDELVSLCLTEKMELLLAACSE